MTTIDEMTSEIHVPTVYTGTMETTNKHRCEGRRCQWRGRTHGTFKCTRSATGTVETHVGFTETHYVCNDDECLRSITGGYPAAFTPFKDVKVESRPV